MAEFYTAEQIANFQFENPCDQIERARVAIGAAGFWGHGVLEAPQVFSKIIYEPENDLILAVHAEQFGLVGTFALLGLVATLVYLGFGVALMCRSQFARLLAMGAAVNFGLYATINTMMVLSMLPVVGMPFALMSQGGTVTVFTWIGLGLINNAWINRDLVSKRPRCARLREAERSFDTSATSSGLFTSQKARPRASTSTQRTGILFSKNRSCSTPQFSPALPQARPHSD